MTNERDDLFQLILGRTTTKAVERILAAGYRKLRTITTVEELDALPEGSVIRGQKHWHIACKEDIESVNPWAECGGRVPKSTAEIARYLPAVVLSEPGTNTVATVRML